MKQFVRRLLLVTCTLLVGAWGWSVFHSDSLQISINKRVAATIEIAGGTIYVATFPFSGTTGTIGYHFREVGFSDPIHNLPTYLGFRLPGINYNTGGSPITIYRCPLWLLFTPLLLITLKLWYAPLKAWWRGTERKGFEVELSNQEKNQDG